MKFEYQASNIETNKISELKKSVLEQAEKLNIPILNEENIDETLGDEPYLSHALVADSNKITKILEDRKLQSSKQLNSASMTYESDKLIDMDINVFFALGKGYMRKDTYSLIFDFEKLAKMPNVSFVKEDLMEFEGKVIRDFLDKHSNEIIEIINKNKEKIEEIFKEKVTKMFQGGHGIYEKYFSKDSQNRVQDFIKAIESKGFKELGNEKEVIDQFTILSDTILSVNIMPLELRNGLKDKLKKQIIEPYTIIGEEEIKKAIYRCWESDKSSYKKFLPYDKRVPEKVTEIRIENEIELQKAIKAIYVPKK